MPTLSSKNVRLGLALILNNSSSFVCEHNVGSALILLKI